MYYDNQNPFGRDSYTTLMIKDTRRAFSRFHLGILAYIGSAYVISIIVDLILFAIMGDSYTSLAENIYFQWGMGVLPMYAVGLPLLYITVRNMPTKNLPKSRLRLGEFLIIFAIAQALMTVGNTIGTSLNAVFGEIRGEEITNSTSELIENSPIWLTLPVAVIIGPIIEEFIFRKLMLDRLSRYGAVVSIVISGLSFGLFHGNLYQFFYAALLGSLLAFVTLKTGNWLYSVILHILINFFGSVLAMPFIDMLAEVEAGIAAIETGAELDILSFANSALLLTSYALIEYALVIVGAVCLALAIKNKWYTIKNTAEVNIPKEEVASAVIFNLGTMLFIAVSLVLCAISVLLG